MNQELKRLWVQALRSGKYEQARSAFCVMSNGNGVSYCALGVLVKEANLAITPNTDWCDTVEGLGVSVEDIDTLVELNDTDKKSFSEIADWIEGNL